MNALPVDPNAHFLTRGNVAEILARRENMETHLGKDSRKAQDVEFKTDAMFFEYESQMLLLLDDFHLQEIADRTLLRPVPAPGVPNPLLLARQQIWDLANRFVYKIIYRGLSTANGGIEQVSGVARNDGAALFLRLREKNYGIADHTISELKAAFFNPTIFIKTADALLKDGVPKSAFTFHSSTATAKEQLKPTPLAHFVLASSTQN